LSHNPKHNKHISISSSCISVKYAILQISQKGEYMKDKDLFERFGVPVGTLYVWKNKEKTNWRYKLYWFMVEKLAEEKGQK